MIAVVLNIRNAAGAVVSQQPISEGEAQMPGYVEHCASQYVGTEWSVERVDVLPADEVGS